MSLSPSTINGPQGELNLEAHLISDQYTFKEKKRFGGSLAQAPSQSALSYRYPTYLEKHCLKKKTLYDGSIAPSNGAKFCCQVYYPTVIQNLTVSEVTKSSAFIKWIPPVVSATSYHVSVTGTPASTQDVTLAEFNMTNLIPGNYYTCTVSANNIPVSISFNTGNLGMFQLLLVLAGISVVSVMLSELWTYSEALNVPLMCLKSVCNSEAAFWLLTSEFVKRTGRDCNTYNNLGKLIILIRAALPVNVRWSDLQPDSSFSIFLIIEPGKVQELTTSNITTSSISLSWQPPEGNVTSYLIKIQEIIYFRRIVTSNFSTIEKLTPGNYYTFLVSVQVGENEIEGEESIISEYTVPSSIESMTIENISISSVFLSWPVPPGNRSLYEISVSGIPSLNFTANSEFVFVDNLVPGNYYTFIVSASAGNGLSGQAAVHFTNTKPEKIQELTTFNTTTSSISLSWQPPEGNVTSYLIKIQDIIYFRRIVTSNFSTIEELTPGNYYTFLVSVLVGDNEIEGEESIISDYTVPASIESVTIEIITTSSVFLSWPVFPGNRSSYEISVSGIPSSNVTMYSEFIYVDNLVPGNYYTFIVSASAGNGLSGQAAVIFTNTKKALDKKRKTSTLAVGQEYKASMAVTNPCGKLNLCNTFSKYNQWILSNAFSASSDIKRLDPYWIHRPLATALCAFHTVTQVMHLGGTIFEHQQFGGESPGVSYRSFPEGVGDHSKFSATGHCPLGKVAVELQMNVFFRGTCPDEQQVINVPPVPGDALAREVHLAKNKLILKEPGKVKELTTSNITTSSISLSWQPPEGNVTSYLIKIQDIIYFRRIVTSNFSTIEELTPGNDYTFLVSVLVGENEIEGEESIISDYTVPASIESMTIENITTNSVFLSWPVPPGNRSSYEISVSGIPSSNFTENSEFFFVDNLVPGNYYTFIVSASAGNGLSGQAAVNFTNTKPEKIQELTTFNITTSSISLSWQPPEGNVTSYLIKIQEILYFRRIVTSNFSTIEELTPGNYYTFLVSVLVGENEIEGEESIISDYTVPASIESVTIENITTNSVFLSWPVPPGNRSSYEISVSGIPSSNFTENSEFVFVDNLVPGNYYTFIVSASAGNGLSGQAAVNFTNIKPEKIQELTTFNITTSSISLSWQPPEGNVTSYLIKIQEILYFRRIVTTNFSTIEELTPGNYYTFLVSVLVGDNEIEGEESIISDYTVPASIESVTIENITTNSVLLSWPVPPGNRSSYDISVSGIPSSNFTANSEFVFVDNLVPGNYYTFIVSASAGNGLSGQAAVNFTNTKPEKIKELTTFNITTSSISLSWQPPEGNVTSYLIKIQEILYFRRIVTTNFSTIEELTSGNYYTFLVSVLVGDNEIEGEESIISDYTVPASIESVTIENITTNSVLLSWPVPPGNRSSYEISLSGIPSSNFTANSEFVFVDNLVPGNYYTFIVSASAGNGLSGQAAVNFTNTKPEKIKELTTFNITTSSISLSWQPPEGNVTSYLIKIQEILYFRRIVTTNFSTIEELTPGNYYTFLVSVLVGENEIEGEESIISDYTVPASIESVTIENITTNSVFLSWPVPPGNRSSYEISVSGIPSSNFTANSEFVFVDNLVPGNYYTFIVSASAGNGLSGQAAVNFTNTKPEKIQELTTFNITTSSISLSWQPPEGNVTSYLIKIQEILYFRRIVTTNFSTIEELTPGNYYTFLVSVLVGENEIEGEESIISDYTVPASIESVTIENITTNSVFLSWPVPPGNRSSYEISVSGIPSSNFTANSEFVFVDNLVPGNYYTFIVSASAGNGLSGQAAVNFTNTKPEKIQELTTFNITTSSISLSWQPPEGNVTSYLIKIQEILYFRRIVTTNFSTIEELTPGNYYTFLVSVLVGENEIEGEESIISDYTVPASIESVTIENITTNSVFLSWPVPPGNRSSYDISVSGIPSSNFTANSEFVFVDNLVPGNYYTFIVSASAGNGLSGQAAVNFTNTKPEKIQELTTSNITTSSISLSWQPPEGNVTSYLIKIQENSTFRKIVTNNFFTIEELTPGNYYTFLVSVLVGENEVEGEESIISDYTVPAPVENGVIENITTSSVVLSWPVPTGRRSSYEILVSGTPSLNFTVYPESSLLVDGLILIPAAIENVILENITTSSVFVKWPVPPGNQSWYEVQVIGAPSWNLTVYSESVLINQLVSGNYYIITVSARGGNGLSGQAAEKSTFINPGNVTIIYVAKVNTTSLFVKWSNTEGNRSAYLVEILGEPPQTFSVTSESVTITSLSSSIQYIVRISAVAGENNQQQLGVGSDISVLLSDTLSSTDITTTSIQLVWEHINILQIIYSITVFGVPSKSWSGSEEQVVFDGLTAGNLYTINLSAKERSSILYGYGGQISLFTRPDIIRDVQLGNISTTSVDLIWNAPVGNHSYYSIEITGDIYQNLTTSSESFTTHELQELTPGTKYTFKITAVAGENIPGAVYEISTFTEPDIVQNVTISWITTTDANLTWVQPKGGRWYYQIDVSGASVNNLTSITESLLISNLIPGSQYTFSVNAVVGDNNTQGQLVNVSGTTPPDVVRDVKFGNVFTTSVDLSWLPPIGNYKYYKINVTGDFFQNLTTSSESLSIKDLTPGTYYTFTILAVSEGETEGATQSITTYTIPASIENVVIENITTSSVVLSWPVPTGNGSSYEILVSGTPSLNFTVYPASSLLVDGLIPGNYYTFIVFAKAGNGLSGAAAVNSTYTKPGNIQELTTSNITTSSISLSWQPPEGNLTSYLIKIQTNSTFGRVVTSNFSTIDELTPGNYYTFVVSVLVGENEVEGEESIISDYAVPASIENVAIVNVTTSSVLLSWPVPRGNRSSYEILVSGTPSTNMTVNSEFVSVDNLVPGNYYTFTISAKAGNGLSGQVAENSTNIIPRKIQELTTSNITTTSISLSWQPPEGNLTSYLIKIQENSTFRKIVTSNFSTIEELIPGNYYTFLVSVLVGEHEVEGEESIISDYTVPASIENVAIVNVTTSSVFLSWPVPPGNRSSYVILVSGTPSTNMTVNSEFVSVDNVVPGNFYTFTISAKAGNGLSGQAAENSTNIIPGKIQELTTSNITTSSISLSWQPPEGNLTSYLIKIQENATFRKIVASNFSTIEELIPGNYYTFLVSVLVGENEVEGEESIISDYTVPASIENVAIVNVTTSSVLLSWPVPPGNRSSYEILVSGTPSTNMTVNSEFVSVDNLVPGNYYTFTISAKAGNGLSGQAAENSTNIIPGKIQELTTSNITTTSISLSWQPPEGNLTSYLIKIQENSTFRKIVTSNFSTIEELIPGNYYTFLVSVLVGEQEVEGEESIISDYTVPASIENVAIVNVTTSSVLLSWPVPPGNRSSYEILVSGTPSTNMTVNSEFVSVDNLVPGNYYTFTISAKAGNGLSGQAAENSTNIIPGKIQELTTSNITTTSISLSWQPPEGNLTSYLIKIQENSTFRKIVTSNFSTIEELIPGNYYTFLVSVLVGEQEVEGEESIISDYTVPASIENVAIVNVTTSSVLLSWPVPPGNRSSYEILVSGTPSTNMTVNSEFVSVDNLVPGNYYTFTISAKAGNGLSGQAAENSTNIIPGKIQELTTSNITTTSISLSWQPPEGNLTSYLIKIQENATFRKIVTSNFSTIEELIPGNYYTFLISVLVGEHEVEGEESIISDYTVPASIENVAIVNVTTSSVLLSWPVPPGNRSSYEILVSGTPSTNMTVNSEFVSVDNLVPGNYYTFTISAKAGNGLSGQAAENSTNIIPGKIQELTTSNITTTSISLSWQPPEGNLTSYLIKIQENSTFRKIVTSNFSTIEELIPGNYYTFLVSVLVGEQEVEGEESIISDYTVPAAIENVAIVNVTTSSVFLSWPVPPGNRSSYEILVSGTPSTNMTVNSEFVSVDNLVPGNYYTFTISAKAGNGLSGQAAENSTNIKPGKIQELTTSNITTTSISLSWQPPEGNLTSYLIKIQENATFRKIVTSNFSTIEELIPGNYYTFLVSILVGEHEVEGEESIISDYTVPASIENVAIVNVTTSSVLLSWPVPPGNRSSYEILVSGTPSTNMTVYSEFVSVDNLVPGNYYTFTISAKAGNGLSGQAAEKSTNIIPGKIQELTTSNITTTSISLSWQPPEGNLTSYLIKIQENSTFRKIVTSNFSTNEELIPGNNYTFLVSVLVGEHEVEGEESIISDYTVPAAIENVAIVNVTTSSVFLSWPVPRGNRSSYEILVSGTPSTNMTVNSEFVSVDNLVPGNYYTFTISAKAGNGLSGQAAENSTNIIPGKIQELTTSNITTTSISLSWQPPEGNLTSYLIKIQENSTFRKIVTSNFSTIEELIPGNYYTFLVSVLVGEHEVEGEESIISDYTVPASIENVAIVNVTTSSVFLSWPVPPGNRSSYEILVSGTPSTNMTVNSEFVSVDNLVPGNYYTFTISAKAGNGLSGQAAEKSTNIKPGNIQELTTSNITTSSISLSWQPPEGNVTSYLIKIQENTTVRKIVTSNFSTIEELIPGYYYTFLVSVLVGENELEGEERIISDYTVPASVEIVTIVNITTSSVFLSWPAPTGNRSSFKLHVSGIPSTNMTVYSEFFFVNNLVAGNYYTFTVFAKAANGLSGQAAENSTNTIPAPVENVFIENITTSSVVLSWPVPTGNRSSYEILVSGTPSLNFTVYPESSLLVDGLIPGNYYIFAIFAKAGHDLIGAEAINSTYTNPGNVTILYVAKVNSTSLFVEWSYTEGNRSAYLVEILGEPPQTFSVTSESVTITSLSSNVQYIVRISAVAGENNQQQLGVGSEISVLLSDTLSSTDITTTSIQLVWEHINILQIIYSITVFGVPPKSWSGSEEQVVFDGLTAGNLYTIQLSAKERNSTLYGYGGQISLFTRPEIIRDVQLGNISTTSVDLIWNAPVGNHSYYSIEITGDIYQNLTTSSESFTTHELQELTPGSKYTIKITAVAGENIPGAVYEISTFTEPDIVQNVTISWITTTDANVTWVQPKGGRWYYQIDVSGASVKNLTSITESLLISNLIPGSQYTFSVNAVVGDNNTRGQPVNVSGITPPDVVRDVKFGNVFTTSVDLSWLPPIGNYKYYKINVAGDFFQNLTTSSESLSIKDLTPGTYYTFTILAVSEGETEGATQAISTYTIPALLVNMVIENITTSSVVLSWPVPTGNRSSYEILVSGTPSLNFTVYPASSLLVDGLIPGNYYTFIVFARAGNGLSGAADVNSTYTKPGKVQELTTSNITTSSISLSWQPPEGNVTSYLIKIQENATFRKIATSNFSTIEELIPGYYYTFLVSGLVGENEAEGEESIISNYTVPAPIVNVVMENITTSSVVLSWPVPTGNRSSYEILVLGTPSLNFTVYPASSLLVDGLIPGNYYTFIVFARAGNGLSGAAAENYTYTKPGKVQELTTSNITTSSISLSWQPPEGNVTSYLIKIQENTTFRKLVTSNSSTIEELIPGNYYTFLVSGLVGENEAEGEESIISNYTVPAPLVNMVIENITTNSVVLSWPVPTGNRSSYEILVSGTPSLNFTVYPASSLLVDGLIPGNYYTFIVFARAGNGLSGAADVNSTYTKPGNVQELTTSNITTSSLSLSWQPPEGNVTSYLIKIQENATFRKIVTSNFSTIEELIPGYYYTFLVSVLVGENEAEGEENIISNYTVPAPIVNMVIENITTSSVVLSWPVPTGNRSSYEILVSGTPSLNFTVYPASSLLVDGLIPGNYYTFIVFARAGNGLSGAADVNSTYTKPGKVQELTTSNITTSSISLSWQPPEGNVTSYLIKIQENATFRKIVTSNFSTIEELIPGYYYTFLVSVLVGENEAEGEENIISNYTVPAPIVNMVIENITTSSVVLSWPVPTGNRSSYEILVSGTPSLNFTVYPASSLLVDGLIPGNYYTFIVFARAGNGLSGAAAVNSTYTKPGKVQELTTSNITTSSISLSWQPPEGNVTSYLIKIQENATFRKIATFNFSTIEELIPGYYYTFLVSILVGDNEAEGEESIISNYTVPAPLVNMVIENITTRSVVLSWPVPTGNRSSYEILVSGTPSLNFTVYPASSLLVDGLIPGNYYTFIVFARAGNGLSGAAAVNSTYTKPGKIQELTTSNITTSSISLSWQPPEGNVTSYLIKIQENATFRKIATFNFSTIEELIPGYYYTFLVSILVGDNEAEGEESIISNYTVPAPLVNMVIENITTRSVVLSWPVPTGNRSSYEILVSGTPSLNFTVYPASSLLVDGLIPGNYYTFIVFARAGNGLSGAAAVNSTYTKPGKVQELTTSNITTSSKLGPDIIRDLQFGNISTTSVDLIWNAPVGNHRYYSIEVTGDIYQNLTTSSESFTTHELQELTPGTKYTFKITAIAGENIPGAVYEISTFTEPDIVQNVTISWITTTYANLTWVQPKGGRRYYQIEVSGASVNILTSITESLLISNLIPGSQYTFSVNAVVGDNNTQGQLVNVSGITPPDVVRDVKFGNVFTTSVDLSWLPPIGNYKYYKINVAGDFFQNLTTSSESLSIKDLTPGTYYTFTILAVSEEETEGATQAISTYTIPGNLTIISAFKVNNSSLYTSWLPSEGKKTAYVVDVLGEPPQKLTVTTESVTINSLSFNIQYTIRIYAFVGENDLQKQGSSSEISVILSDTLSSLDITTTSVKLVWEHLNIPQINYSITVFGIPTQSWSGPLEEVTFSGLTPGNLYTFRLSAYQGNSTLYGYGGQISLFTIPGKVQNLNTVSITNSSVSLSWLPPVGNSSSYVIRILENSSFLQTVTVNSVTIENLTPGYYYTFLVSAQVGDPLLEVPESVQNLTTVSINNTSVSLSWIPPVGNSSSYLIGILENLAFMQTVTVNSVTIENLTPGYYYTFLVSVQVGEPIVKGQYKSISAITIPAMVQNLYTVNITSSSVSLSWLPPVGNSSLYLIRILEDSSFLQTVTVNSVTIKNLTPGYYYTFLVSAQVGNPPVEGQKSSISTYTIPKNVQNLTTVSITNTSVSLSWIPPVGNSSSYLIGILENSTFMQTVTVNSVTIENLTPGYYYTFLVSVQVGEPIVKGQYNSISVITKPGKVQNLILFNITTSSLSLSWQPPVGNLSSYLIQIMNNLTFRAVVTINSFNIDHLTPGNYYTFLVTAQVGYPLVEGQESSISTNTFPGKVQNLTTFSITNSSVSLSWLPPVGNSSSYVIRILENSSFLQTVTVNSVTIENLIPGYYYTFLVSVQVGNPIVEGQYNSISAITKPGRVQNLILFNITTSSLSLSWQPPVGNFSSYLIQIMNNLTFRAVVTINSFNIGDLKPGNYYTFLVTAQVGYPLVEGQESSISTYTYANSLTVSLNYYTSDVQSQQIIINQINRILQAKFPNITAVWKQEKQITKIMTT
ncbi:titin-like [Pelodytes ibericus]